MNWNTVEASIVQEQYSCRAPDPYYTFIYIHCIETHGCYNFTCVHQDVTISVADDL